MDRWTDKRRIEVAERILLISVALKHLQTAAIEAALIILTESPEFIANNEDRFKRHLGIALSEIEQSVGERTR